MSFHYVRTRISSFPSFADGPQALLGPAGARSHAPQDRVFGAARRVPTFSTTGRAGGLVRLARSLLIAGAAQLIVSSVAVQAQPTTLPIDPIPGFSLLQESIANPSSGSPGDSSFNQGISQLPKDCTRCGAETNLPDPHDVQGSLAGHQAVMLHSGQMRLAATDLIIPGRGIDWQFSRIYRSGVSYDGPLGNQWMHNYLRYLVPVSPTTSLPSPWNSQAVVGDVVRVDGGGFRVDVFKFPPAVLLGVAASPGDNRAMAPGTGGALSPERIQSTVQYISPPDIYTLLYRNNNDGSFDEIDLHGNHVHYGPPDSRGMAKATLIEDTLGNTLTLTYYSSVGPLWQVKDTLGRQITYDYYPVTDSNPGRRERLASVTDFTGRVIRFDYSSTAELSEVRLPDVAGTPTGNDFPNGVLWKYTYNQTAGGDHLLKTETAPNEATTSGPARLVITYTSASKVINQTTGGLNYSGVGAGGTVTYSYQSSSCNFVTLAAALAKGSPDEHRRAAASWTPGQAPSRASPQGPAALNVFPPDVIVTDPAGNQTSYCFDTNGKITDVTEFTNRDVVADQPSAYSTAYSYNSAGELTSVVRPMGNSETHIFDTGNANTLARGNQLASIRHADPTRGGDQAAITNTYTSDPIYNRIRTATEARGNDPQYVPPNGGANSPARYTTYNTFDYEEACDAAALAARLHRTTSEVQQLFAATAVCSSSLGDVNSDGRTTQNGGQVIRIQHPTVKLLANSRMKQVIGTDLQTIVETDAYNQHGQLRAHVNAEGNVTEYTYYPENQPGGTQLPPTPGVGNGPFGYLQRVGKDVAGTADCNDDNHVDAGDVSAVVLRVFNQLPNATGSCDANIDDGLAASDVSCTVLQAFGVGCGIFPHLSRNTSVATLPANIRSDYVYDAVGNVIKAYDPRRIGHTIVYNALNWPIQMMWAAEHSSEPADPPEPTAPIDYAYLQRTLYDANGNATVSQTEDRGNTSSSDGQGALGSLPYGLPQSPDPLGGVAFVDAVTKRDILDRPVLTMGEVCNTCPIVEYPTSRVRYDANGNQVLVIAPEGNATTYEFDERDLLVRATSGAHRPPPHVILAAGDPIDYAVRAGNNEPWAATVYHHDKNGNVIEVMDPADSDAQPNNALLSSRNNSKRALPMFWAGRSSGGNASLTLNDNQASWVPGQWPVNYASVQLTGGTGAGQLRRISTNTATQLSLSSPVWTTIPDATSTYIIFPGRISIGDISTGGNTATTLNVPASMPPVVFYGVNVQITGGTGLGEVSRVMSQAGTTLTVDPPWSVIPDATSTFVVYGIQNSNFPNAAIGDRTRYLYDGFDRVTSVVDSLGNQLVDQFDAAGHSVRRTRFGPKAGVATINDGPETLASPVSLSGTLQTANLVTTTLLAASEASYDEAGRRYQTDRALFVNTIFVYRAPDVDDGADDTATNKSSLTPGDTCAIPGLATPPGGWKGCVSTRFEFDRSGRNMFIVQDDGDIYRFFYDGADRLWKQVDPLGNATENAFDDAGNLIEVRRTEVTEGGGVPNEIFLTTYDYDSLNRMVRFIDNLGETWELRYDSRGNLVARSDAKGPPGPTISRRAFPNGPRTVNTTNAFGNVTRFTYDGLGRRTLEEHYLTASGEGDGLHIGADANGAQTAPPAVDPTQGGGDGIIRLGTVYDLNSLPVAQLDDQGNATVYFYDNLDRLVAETGGVTVNSSAVNLLSNVFPPAPMPETINASLLLSLGGQRTSIKNRLTAVSSLFPPLADRVDDNPSVSTYHGLDAEGNQLLVLDENGSRIINKVDGDDRPIAVRVCRAGQSDTHSGDPIFAPTCPSATNPPFPDIVGSTKVDYEYDGLGRRVRARDYNDPATTTDDSEVTTAYDSLNRVIEEVEGLDGSNLHITSSAWRAENLRIKLTYHNNRVIQTYHDPADRANMISDNSYGSVVADYDYMGPAGRALSRANPANGTRVTLLNDAGTQDIGYDGLGRTIALRNLRADNSTIAEFDHDYDRMSNRLDESKPHDPTDSELYHYDSGGRLLRFDRGTLNGSHDGILVPSVNTPLHSLWQLDGTGNWKQVDGETRQHSSFNEIITRTATTTTTVLSDNNGNVYDDGTLTYEWDFANRLRRATKKTGSQLVGAYIYDGLGRRTRKVVTNSGSLNGTTVYSHDGWDEIEERTSTDQLMRQYVYGSGIDEPLVLDRDTNGDGSLDTRVFYQPDSRGDIAALTSITGTVVERYLYDAYGRTRISDASGTPITTSAVANPYQFTARRADPETGLLYYRARYLDPIQGRFLSRDPLGMWEDEASLGNGYAYVGSDPVGTVDPMGLFEVKASEAEAEQETSNRGNEGGSGSGQQEAGSSTKPTFGGMAHLPPASSGNSSWSGDGGLHLKMRSAGSGLSLSRRSAGSGQGLSMRSAGSGLSLSKSAGGGHIRESAGGRQIRESTGSGGFRQNGGGHQIRESAGGSAADDSHVVSVAGTWVPLSGNICGGGDCEDQSTTDFVRNKPHLGFSPAEGGDEAGYYRPIPHWP